MDTISRFPIAICSNYRTGSTALCQSISKKYNILEFEEPHLKSHQEFDTFKNKINSNSQDFVTKFIVNHITEHPIYQLILDSDCYKIKLYRDNKINQITSFYIAEMTGDWGTSKYKPVGKDYVVDINQEVMLSSIETIKFNDMLLDNLPTKFDLVCSYESLGIIDSIDLEVKKTPVNINDIKSCIKHFL